MKLQEFETFKDLRSSYIVNQLRLDKPSCINFLSYRKYKVTIELVEETNEELIERLRSIDTENNHHRKTMVDNEIKILLL